jgi:hypothetical protein
MFFNGALLYFVLFLVFIFIIVLKMLPTQSGTKQGDTAIKTSLTLHRGLGCLLLKASESLRADFC